MKRKIIFQIKKVGQIKKKVETDKKEGRDR